ncbi:unnamed protein product, partial [Brassicogethes aeneus]
MDRYSQGAAPPVHRGRPVSGMDAAHATEYFEHFMNATSMKTILGYYRRICEYLHLKPNVFPLFYPKLRAHVTSWKAKALLKKFDARASHKCYGKGKICANTRVLIIGAGPCGLRSAIEAQLLGAKVVVIEKRDRLSRNNVLHLWPFVIEDLRALGAKRFFGKFCAGAIDHISIRQLQCILLKIALVLGVEIHTEVSFEKMIEPNVNDKTGWRAEFKPADHPVSQYEFDVILAADGKRNTLHGFKRKEFRGKLAIAITANFINKKTEAEARVEEISGVAFIFNQKFFKDLYEETRIDLENIVYYKDDTHYFVMTAKKASLIEKGVIKQDLSDTEKLLGLENVDRDALQEYAKEAANFSTNYQMPNLEFAVNHYGQPDVAMFDFTSMYAAENASKTIERNGYQLLMILVGDSLLEPFWPTGSGCARGFLSSLDAAWAIRSWASPTTTPLDVMAERESIYRLLAQTTPDNLNKDWKSYTLDPATRYPNLNKNVVLAHQVINLYETDNPDSIDKMRRNIYEAPQIEMPKKRRRGDVDNEVLLSWISDQVKEHEDIFITDLESVLKDGKVLCAIVHHYRPDLLDYNAIKDGNPATNNQLAFDVLEKELGIPPISTGEEIINIEDYLTMASYLTQVYHTFRGEIPHIKHPKLDLPESSKRTETTFKTVKLSDYQAAASQRLSSRHKRHADAISSNKPTPDRKTRKRRTLERVGASVDHENKLPSLRAGNDEDLQARIKSLENKWKDPQPVDRKPKDLLRAIGKIDSTDWNIKEIEKKILENKLGKSVNKDKERVPKWSKEEFLARQTKMESKHLDRQDSAEAKFADIDKNIKVLDHKLKEGTVRDLGQNKVATITEKLVSKVPPPKEEKPVEKAVTRPPINLPTQAASEFCHFCDKRVYLMERLSAEGRFFHHGCFKCQYCHTQLRLGSYSFDRDGQYGHKFFCIHHYGMQGELPRSTKVVRKSSHRQPQQEISRSPEKKRSAGVAGLDLLDRVQTPERIEFANLSTGSVLSDVDEPLSQMDEDEWTDKNFGASCAEELDDSDDDSSSYSDTDSDDDAYDDALEEPATKEGTMRLAQKLKYYRKKNKSDSDGYSSSDQSSYDENSSDDDESDTATEGEDEIRARELRKQEVNVEPPVVHTDTGTDTEVVSDETSSESSSEVQNSATEISTDSEFAQDDPTPTREIPSITFNDCNVTKVRGSSGAPRRLQVTSGYLQKPLNGKKSSKPNIELKLSPLVPSAPIIKKPAPVLLPRTEGYALNRTQSTGGIAAKKSLELKKKYLLGESAHPGCIQKSGSASTLDNKFKNFQTDVSDYQKLLKPSAEISASMKVFCTKLDENYSSKISPSSSPQPISTETTQEETKNGYTSTPPLPPPDITKDTEKAEHYVFQNELEGRPRSPVHETSIIVPEIDWSKNKKSQTEESSSSESSSENELASTPNYDYTNIPKVEVHSAIDEEDIPPDSLCIIEDPKNKELEEQAEPVKSIASEKKSLNQPKSLPYLEKMLPEIHNSLHVRYKKEEPENTKTNKENVELETKSSGRSTPDSLAEQVTVALTETELSDWAREGEVSDDLEEFAEFELNEHIETNRSAKNPKNCMAENIKKADIAELDDFGHVCGKAQDFVDVKNMVLEDSCKSINVNFDNIEFMDTGTETSSDEGVVDSQNGYVLFKNDDEIPEDSLNPIINQLVEAKNEHLGSKLEGIKNTGYCIISNMENNFGSEVIDLKPSDLEKLKQKQAATEHEDDSLLIVDTGTTTEENTCSDSTVKNVSDIRIDKAKAIFENNNSQKQRLEEKLASVKAEQALLKQNSDQNKQSSHNKIIVDDVNLEFDEHCHRLQSKVDFGNAKDSIDIRKSRRKSKSEVTPKPDLIQEEKDKPSPVHAKKDITLNLTPTVRTPDVLYKKENIMKERDDNQRLIQEMVMNKMKAENKSLERRRRNRTPSKQYDLTKSATTDISQINLDNSNRNSTYSNASMYSTPDVLLSTNSVPLQLSHSVNTAEYSGRKENNKPTYNDSVFNDFQTPKAPPRTKNDDITRTSEKMKQVARERARLMSNEDLGLSPEDKFQRVKDKHCKKGKENTQVNNQSVENRNSWLHNNSFMKKKNNSTPKLHSTSTTNLTTAPTRTKSVSGISNNFVIANETPDALKMCKSDPNLLDTEDSKKKKTRGESFLKKSQSFLKKGQTFFKSLSPKKLDKSKSCSNLDQKITETIIETPIIRKSYSEISSINHVDNDVSPPPIPPLPVNYTGNSIKGTDDSSDGEQDWKKHELSSCDNIDQSGMFESSITSVSSRRSKSSRKARQTQLKRHRMAQEIQRKLEETEVKTRELEKRGVLVEKALRGEDSEYSTKDESELLQEWFDLMRDRTELRRYEKELMVRAQELELEDRHARLQHDLRERLESDQKTEADSKAEESIITEMLDIVSKRDSLLAVMEEERLRCFSPLNSGSSILLRKPALASQNENTNLLACPLFLFIYFIW